MPQSLKTILKWSGAAFLLFSFAIFTSKDPREVEWINFLRVTVFILFISITFGLLFYGMERYFVPWQIRRIGRKLTKVFGATSVAENMSAFSIGPFDVYTKATIHLKMSDSGSVYQSIEYHVPRDQINNSPHSLNFKRRASMWKDVPTFLLYQSSGYWMKLDKRKIKKRLLSGHLTPSPADN